MFLNQASVLNATHSQYNLDREAAPPPCTSHACSSANLNKCTYRFCARWLAGQPHQPFRVSQAYRAKRAVLDQSGSMTRQGRTSCHVECWIECNRRKTHSQLVLTSPFLLYTRRITTRGMYTTHPTICCKARRDHKRLLHTLRYSTS